MRSIAIVGGSLAGLSSARALRRQGFDGRLTIISGEDHRPYDRPPLSKSFLAGSAVESDLWLEPEGEDLGAEWLIGVRATALRPSEKCLELSSGSRLSADGVVLATGCTPRTLPRSECTAGVHVLRTLDDARALRAALSRGSRLVIVGAGFIGSEVASTASSLGMDVIVIEAAPTPLAGALGVEMGRVVSRLHAGHNVSLLTGVPVEELVGKHRVTGLRLGDGKVIDADVVLMATGVRPSTDWLDGSGLNTANGVVCNGYGATALKNVVAVGDCATWFEPTLGSHQRLEHWTGARERASIAAATLLSEGTALTPQQSPYFWSDQYGTRIQLAGHVRDSDSITIEEGSVSELDFLAVYRRGSEPVAVLALGHAKTFIQWRRRLSEARFDERGKNRT